MIRREAYAKADHTEVNESRRTPDKNQKRRQAYSETDKSPKVIPSLTNRVLAKAKSVQRFLNISSESESVSEKSSSDESSDEENCPSGFSEKLPPNDFTFDGPSYRQLQFDDSQKFTDSLNASIPTVICSVCDEMHGEADSNPDSYCSSDNLFDPLFSK